jgi:hypothetical protein
MHELCVAITQSDAKSFHEPHVSQRVHIELERIVEKPAPIKYSRQPLAHQHDCIG